MSILIWNRLSFSRNNFIYLKSTTTVLGQQTLPCLTRNFLRSLTFVEHYTFFVALFWHMDEIIMINYNNNWEPSLKLSLNAFLGKKFTWNSIALFEMEREKWKGEREMKKKEREKCSFNTANNCQFCICMQCMHD